MEAKIELLREMIVAVEKFPLTDVNRSEVIKLIKTEVQMTEQILEYIARLEDALPVKTVLEAYKSVFGD